MTLDIRKFTYREQSRTYIAEISDLEIGREIPQKIQLASAKGTPVGEFIFTGPDINHGETTGYYYNEVHPREQPRKLLLIND